MFFFTLLLCIVSSETGSLQARTAITFLTWRPTSDTIDFIQHFSTNLSTQFDVYLVIDDSLYSTSHINTSRFQILQFDETVCVENGFIRANRFGTKKDCSAWDKALFFFSKHFRRHEFVWFIEEDVFIPSIDAFLAVHQLYSNSNDLVVPDVVYNTDGSPGQWYHAAQMLDAFVLPWSFGMVCAMGASRRLLSEVERFVQWRGHLVFIEFLFHTLVLHHPTMKVVAPIELSTIVYRKYISIQMIEAAPNNWWHPVKNISQQRQWRQVFRNRTPMLYEHFLINLNSISRRIDRTETNELLNNVVHDLKILTIQFHTIQPLLDSSSRYKLRQQFLDLASNRSDPLKKMMIYLANAAFKLSEDRNNMFSNETKERWLKLKQSPIVIKMENMLEENERTIVKSIERESKKSIDEMVTIRWLRDEATRLIAEINKEMICEMKKNPCNRTRQWFEWQDGIHQVSSLDSTEYLMVILLLMFCVLILVYISLNKRGITQRA